RNRRCDRSCEPDDQSNRGFREIAAGNLGRHERVRPIFGATLDMATTAEPTAQQFPTLIHLAALTHLEGQIRAAKTLQELQFLSVNETRRLIPYDEAFLLILSSSSPDKEAYRVLNASSVAVVDRDAPLIVWLEQAVQALRRPGNTSGQPMVVTEELLPDSLHSGWREFMKEHVFWCPLQHPDETVPGAW